MAMKISVRGLSSTLKSVLEISLIAPDLLQNLSDVCW